MRNELLEKNLRFYDSLWADAHLIEPQRFNTWPLVQSLLTDFGRRLEVAPGLRPRLPIEGTQFVDVSASALSKLRERGAHVVLGTLTSLPFASESFDLVCALDIIEHVDDDDDALAELSRVTRSDGTVLISTPLHLSRWTTFDEFVGHRRRYEPSQLFARLAQHHFRVDHSAVFGMQPRSSLLLKLGMWWLTHHRERAMRLYNRKLMPLGLRFQKDLKLVPGIIDTDKIDEILLVCRRNTEGPRDD
jgi:SAM-dependent methyltransferase